MKKTILFMMVALAIISCEPEEKVYSGNAIGIAESTFQVSVAPTGTTLTIPILATVPSAEARSFDAEVIAADDQSEFTVGTVNIPANSYEGTLDIVFDFNAIAGEDGLQRNASIGLPQDQGIQVFATVADITYFKAIICNDLEFEVVSDIFGMETSFEITDENDNVVAGAQGVPLFSSNSCTQMTYNQTITLPDGNYTLTVFDSFGDGQVGNNSACGPDDIIGSYSLTCSIINHAQGSVTGSEDVIDFSVNQ